MRKLVLGWVVVIVFAAVGRAQIVITEVDSAGSNATYAKDWFELTNTGASSVNITGWAFDDDSHSFGAAISLRGVTSIAAGQSVVFMESDTAGANDAANEAAFKTAWFGSTVPAGFTIGTYGGSGVSLSSTNGDQVNIFDSLGNPVTGVAFGSNLTLQTFDNAAGAGNTSSPGPTISTLSVVGVNGAFLAPDGETGSPGVVPEPASLGLMGLGSLAIMVRRRQAR